MWDERAERTIGFYFYSILTMIFRTDFMPHAIRPQGTWENNKMEMKILLFCMGKRCNQNVYNWIWCDREHISLRKCASFTLNLKCEQWKWCRNASIACIFQFSYFNPFHSIIISLLWNGIGQSVWGENVSVPTSNTFLMIPWMFSNIPFLLPPQKTELFTTKRCTYNSRCVHEQCSRMWRIQFSCLILSTRKMRPCNAIIDSVEHEHTKYTFRMGSASGTQFCLASSLSSEKIKTL